MTQSPAISLGQYKLQLLKAYTCTELVISFILPPVMPKPTEMIVFETFDEKNNLIGQVFSVELVGLPVPGGQPGPNTMPPRMM